jgi:hypothetical protein
MTFCSFNILCCYALYFQTLNFTLKLHIVFEEMLVDNGVTRSIVLHCYGLLVLNTEDVMVLYMLEL